MDPLVDMLVLTGFLSAVFCVLGIIAGLCEWVEQRFRHLIIRLWRKPPLLTRVRTLPVKNAGKMESDSRARWVGDSVRVVTGLGVHRKAA